MCTARVFYIVGGKRIYGGKFFARFSQASKTRGYSIFKNNFKFGPKVSNNDDEVMYEIEN